jgi:hypothetical protein
MHFLTGLLLWVVRSGRVGENSGEHLWIITRYVFILIYGQEAGIRI